MNETILEALTRAAMLHADDGAALADDLAKIHKLLDSAANSDLAQGSMTDGHQAARSLHSAGLGAGESKIPLREDEISRESLPESVVKQSKRHDEPYNAVPRVV